MKQSKTLKLAKAKADKYFSLFIRIRYANAHGMVKCCTCGKFMHYKQCDAGHFIARNHESTRYDEKNAHAQCATCNRFQSGHQFKHAKFVDKTYGVGTSDLVLQKSKMLCKRKKFDYEHLAQEFKLKYEQIKKEKCIT